MKATTLPIKKTKKAKQAKDEGKPKRSLNVYNLFFAIERKKILDDNVKVGFANLARIVSERWKNIDPAYKLELEEQARLDRIRFEEEMQQWREKKGAETEQMNCSDSTVGSFDSLPHSKAGSTLSVYADLNEAKAFFQESLTLSPLSYVPEYEPQPVALPSEVAEMFPFRRRQIVSDDGSQASIAFQGTMAAFPNPVHGGSYCSDVNVMALPYEVYSNQCQGAPCIQQNSFCYPSMPTAMTPMPYCEPVLENSSSGFTINHMDEHSMLEIREFFANIQQA
jgi:hypothetical protein